MKISSLEDLIKKYLSKNEMAKGNLSYDKHSFASGGALAKSYSDAAAAIYASAKRELPEYGVNNAAIDKKGLQNSGYASYVSKLSESKMKDELGRLKENYNKEKEKTRASYAAYLDKRLGEQSSLRSKVVNHLVSNDVTDLGTAVAYGISAGLSEEDAALAGTIAYETTKNKVISNILEQSAKLGLDSEGAEMLAVKMGLTEDDARYVASEVEEFLKHYKGISEDYLEFLKTRQ